MGSCFICMCNFVCIHVSLKRLISRVDSNVHEVFEVMGCVTRVESWRLHDISIPLSFTRYDHSLLDY